MPFDPRSNKVRVHRGKRFDWARDFSYVPVDRLDAATNIFFERELKHIIPQLFAVEFAEINARTIFPVYFANDPGAEFITYEQSTEYGEAEIVADYAQDAPTVNVGLKDYDTRVRSIRIAAEWNIQEIRAAARHNRPLERWKADAARNGMMRRENRIAFFGDTDFGLKGLFTDADVPRDNAGGVFSSLTADQQVRELHDHANAIPAGTEDIEKPDTMLIPPTQYDLLATTMIGDNQDRSVLRSFLDNNPHIRTVVRVRELAGAGTGGADVVVAFRRDISKLRMNVALDLEQFPPERRGMAIKVEYHMRVGGLTIHRPRSIRILEGV